MTINVRMIMLLEAAQAKAETAATTSEVKKLTTATGELGAKSKATAAASDAEAAAKVRNAQASRTLAAGNRQASAATGSLVAQFNDIGVMLAAGQSPLQLAIQQGPQITQAFGQAGAAGAVKMLGTAFVQMVNPINLITIVAIAAGAAMIQWLTSAGEEAKTAEDQVKALADATAAYRSAAEASGASVGSLVDKYGSLAMVAAIALNNDAEQKKTKNLAELAAQADLVANSFGSLHEKSVMSARGMT